MTPYLTNSKIIVPGKITSFKTDSNRAVIEFASPSEKPFTPSPEEKRLALAEIPVFENDWTTQHRNLKTAAAFCFTIADSFEEFAALVRGAAALADISPFYGKEDIDRFMVTCAGYFDRFDETTGWKRC